MAAPTEFSESNAVLSKPKNWLDEECLSLPIFRGEGQCISCWKLTPEEIEKIKETGVIWLSVHSGHTQPPVWVGADTPFIEVPDPRKN